MENSGFVYVWYDRKRKMYYVGCHWGREDDGYICSSRRMRNAYVNRPSDFKRRVVQRNIPRERLLDEEYKWLQKIKPVELRIKYYNVTNRKWDNFISKPPKGNSLTPEHKKKLSDANKGRHAGSKHPNWGKSTSDYQKQRVAEANRGKVVSFETRLKLSNASSGKRHTQETKEKLRQIALERKKKNG